MQEFLAPVVASIVFDEKYTPAEAGDIAYAALLGGVMGFFGGEGVDPQLAAEVQRNKPYSSEQAAELATKLISNNPESSYAHQVGQQIIDALDRGEVLTNGDIMDISSALMARSRMDMQNKNAVTKADTAENGNQYKIVQEGNYKYVEADRLVITGNDPDVWSEQVENYINEKIRNGENVQLIGDDGDILTLTDRTAGKIASPYQKGKTIDDDLYEVKVNAGVHIDELAQVSTRGTKIEPDKGGKHGKEASGGWNYRKAYFKDFDGKYYELKLSIQIGSDGNAVYNIGDMKERSFPDIIHGSSVKKDGALSDGETSSTPIITDVDGNSNSEIEQSDAENVEEYDEEAEHAQKPGYLKTVNEWEADINAASILREGKEHGMSVRDIKRLQSLSRLLHRQIRLYTNEAEGADTGGFFDPKTEAIYINAKCDDPVMQTLSHELTHSLEGTSYYDQLAEYVRNNMQWIAKVRYDVKKAEIEAAYEAAKEKGVIYSDTVDADHETVAWFVEHYLLKNEKQIRRLCETKPTLGRRILNWFDRLLVSMGNKKAINRQDLQTMRGLYKKALDEKSGRGYNTSTARGQIESAREGIATGRLTDEQFDAAYDEYAALDLDRNLDVDLSERQHKLSDRGVDNGKNAYSRDSWLEETSKGERSPQNRRTESVVQGDGHESRGTSRGNREKLYHSDSEGREISKNVYDKIAESAIVDEEGKPIALYHGTDVEFDHFEKGDIGFHFGTKQQAEKRVEKKENHIFVRGYLNIKNPVQVSRDVMSWQGAHTALALWDEGILSFEQLNEITRLQPQGWGYDSPASVRLREILADKGYDGLSYPNGFEGEGTSYIAFYDDQIIRTPINEDENLSTREYRLSRSAQEQSDVLSQVRDFLAGKISKSDLQSFVEGVDGDTSSVSSADTFSSKEKALGRLSGEAREIVFAAREAGMSVDEYLRSNAEMYEVDGEYSAAAKEALDSERGGRRAYKVDPDFAKAVDDWDGKSKVTFNVGVTSDILKSIGVKDRGIVWHGGKAAEIMRKHPNMTKEVIKQVPNIMEDPVLVLKSQQHDSRLVIFGELIDVAGDPVLAILELEPTTKGGEVMNINVIASAYGKDSNPAGFIMSSDLLYIDANKNRTQEWVQSVGLQLPSDAITLGSVGSITYPDGKVKISGVPAKQYMQYAPKNTNRSHKLSDTTSGISSMPKKVQNHIEKAENGVARGIEESLHIRGNDNKAQVKDILRAISEEFMEKTINILY